MNNEPKPDLANDGELLECATVIACVYSPRDEWHDLTPHMQSQILTWAAAARDFFRARWFTKPEPKPDFSRDPERVALAKVLNKTRYECLEGVDTRLTEDYLWECVGPKQRSVNLTMADAAISHLGSGYRLPEATEENAERLRVVHAGMFRYAVNPHDPMHYLRALHAAFGDTAEKPEPQCTATNGDYRCELLAGHGGEHSTERLAWEEPSANDILDSEARINFASEAAERERRRLLEAFMHDMVSNPAVMAKMLENHESDEDAIAARLHQIADALTQEIIG